MLKVYTSTIRYSGPDRFDITVKSGERAFAPTWNMVMGHKKGAIDADEYVSMYHELMRGTYRNERGKWTELMARDRVVLVCFCPPHAFCHRLLLADILVKLGATYEGEVS